MSKAMTCTVVAILALTLTGVAGATSPLDARHSPFIGGNASPRFPAGKQGVIALVATSPAREDNGSLFLVVRNNLLRPVEGVRATIRATTPKGRLVGTFTDGGFAHPFHIEPGEIAFVTWDSGQGGPGKLPAHTRLRLSTTFSPGQPVSANPKDFLVTAVAAARSNVLAGTGQNPRAVIDRALPIIPRVFCFSETGRPLYESGGVLERGQVGPSESFPFEVGLLPDRPCPTYLVTVSGGAL